MAEKQSEICRDTQLAMLMRRKWQAEIERAVDKIKFGVVPGWKKTNDEKWW